MHLEERRENLFKVEFKVISEEGEFSIPIDGK